MKKIDLHMHSNFSDGDEDIVQLIKNNKNCGNELISITDHDNVESLGILQEQKNIAYIPGVEMSCEDVGAKVHILAYGISDNSGISEMCKKNSEIRRVLSLEIIEDLIKRGYKLDYQELQRFYVNPKVSLSKVDIAKMLVRSGEASSVKQAFYEILGKYKIGKQIRAQAKTVIETIKDDGGLSVLAHAYDMERKQQINPLPVIDRLVSMGLDGLELSKSHHNKCQRDIIDYICRSKGLIKTDGSDYHGKLTKPDVELGCELNGEELDDRLKEKIIER